jgi:hypothetical protein
LNLFLESIIFDADAFNYSSNTRLFSTEDIASDVESFYNEGLPKANWRLEEDWISHSNLSASQWRRGDYFLFIVLIDNLTSDQINDLNRYYGFENLIPGDTLGVLHYIDRSKPFPTTTPATLPTSEVENTEVPIKIQPNTPAGTILVPGEEWVQDGMIAKLEKQTFIASCGGFLEFELIINNNSTQELVVNIDGNDFSFVDDQGQTYSNDNIWWDFGPNDPECHPNRLSEFYIMTLGPGQQVHIALRVLGDPSPSVDEFYFVIFKAGRINNAQWKITVPR